MVLPRPAIPPEWEMHDLETDPQELINIADYPDQSETRAALEGELQRLQVHYRNDPYTA